MKKLNILLAEDHKLVRESTRQLLDREPNLKVVGEACNGVEAVEMARKLKPDIILMDISMPDLNGVEATKQIKEFQPSVSILVLTAYDYEQYIFPLLDAGAAGYLLKDISGQELVNAINAVSKGDVVLHPSIARKVIWHYQHVGDKRVKRKVFNLLSEEEMTTVNLAAKGMKNKDIALEMHLSIHTIESHLCSIFNKLGVGSRTEAVIQALKRGWVKLEDLP